MQNDLKTFFDKFLNTNRYIFEELKHTINTEQVSFVKNMDYLKKNINNFINGEKLNK